MEDERRVVAVARAQFKIFDHGSDSYDNNLVDCIAGTCDWTGTERFNDACL